jgi:hypothetical protein
MERENRYGAATAATPEISVVIATAERDLQSE